jgi:hypothetical protein
MRWRVLLFVLLSGCAGSLNRCDPPTVYAPDPRCDQYLDTVCWPPDGGRPACCNRSKGSDCNASSGACETFIETPDPLNAVKRGDSGGDA